MLFSRLCQTPPSFRYIGQLNNPFLKAVSAQTRNYGQLVSRRTNIYGSPNLICRTSLSAAKQVIQKRYALSNMAEGVSARAQKIVGWWLMGCAGMCFGAVVLGGVTRLTESGLSMVDWKLFKDMRPPRSEQEWIEEFERYKTFPEYSHILSSGRDFTLSDFKFIFFMEFTHRMWGRITGCVFLLPAPYFMYKGWITKAMRPRLALYTALLGFQGFMGWYMVKSGLEEKPGVNDVPRVSQYRLALHLSTAVALYSLFLWAGMSHLAPNQLNWQKVANISKLNKGAHTITSMIFFTLVSGAFVAGLDAGLVYNTWPKMADRWIPTDLLAYSPTWSNFFENPTTVQFDHRIVGKLTVAAVCAFWWVCRNAPLPPSVKLASNCLLAMSLTQMTLGIFTLLTQVHTHLAATHQAGAITLLSISLWLMHILKRIPK
ncbi:heme A synthase COX15-like [Watersipora subatra]|uniref:heme A synthase COX15-like n=1 Tax=Watersipora subatra TaxID=2589382 RepID=UPI00355BC28D